MTAVDMTVRVSTVPSMTVEVPTVSASLRALASTVAAERAGSWSLPPAAHRSRRRTPTSLAAAASSTRSRPTRIFDTRSTPADQRRRRSGRKPIDAAGHDVRRSDVARPGRRFPTDRRRQRDVLAVVVNITVTDPTSGRLPAIGVRHGAASRHVARSLNFNAGENVPNLAIVGPGTTAHVHGDARMPERRRQRRNVLIDVFGWFSTSDYRRRRRSGARLQPVDPGRILDTRAGPVPAGCRGTPLGPDGRSTLQIRGADAVQPGRHRHRAERPERHRRDAQHHRRRRPDS